MKTFTHTFPSGATSTFSVDLRQLLNDGHLDVEAHIIGPSPKEDEILDWEAEIFSEMGSHVKGKLHMGVNLKPTKANPQWLEFSFSAGAKAAAMFQAVESIATEQQKSAQMASELLLDRIRAAVKILKACKQNPQLRPLLVGAPILADLRKAERTIAAVRQGSMADEEAVELLAPTADILEQLTAIVKKALDRTN
jgi:hypothetical protein